jgi:FkbM family methyltransferase
MNLAVQVPRKMKTLIGRVKVLHLLRQYRAKQRTNTPIDVRVTDCVSIKLRPAGQIPELLYTTNWERIDLALAAAFIQPGMNVVDIGANVGLYSVLAQRLAGPQGTVWAFEPSAESFARLSENLDLNAATSVRAFKMALADQHGGSLVMRRDAGFRDGDRYAVHATPAIVDAAGTQRHEGDEECVPAATLDEFFLSDGQRLPTVDFIKLDVEGGELAVLRGAQRLLKSSPRIVIMFECVADTCQRAGHQQDEVFGLLQGMGFGLYGWHATAGSWRSDDELLATCGNVWACRDATQLPQLPAGHD